MLDTASFNQGIRRMPIMWRLRRRRAAGILTSLDGLNRLTADEADLQLCGAPAGAWIGSLSSPLGRWESRTGNMTQAARFCG